jgi:hypothetical protein
VQIVLKGQSRCSQEADLKATAEYIKLAITPECGNVSYAERSHRQGQVEQLGDGQQAVAAAVRRADQETSKGTFRVLEKPLEDQ